MKNVGNNSRGRSQGVPKIFRAPMYRSHCAVIFAIAQLSCQLAYCLMQQQQQHGRVGRHLANRNDMRVPVSTTATRCWSCFLKKQVRMYYAPGTGVRKQQL